jgi:glycosyltransferase involved in cell wall biosynthesis
MGRVLVVGIGPIPIEQSALPLGPGMRTWHFASQLHAAGHRVRLVTIRPWERIDDRQPPVPHADGLEEFRVRFNPSLQLDANLAAACADFQPDAIFGITVPAAARVAPLAAATPFWADVFGDYLAEAQLKAERTRDDGALGDWHRELAAVLARADMFSAVSRRQAWALVGQIGSARRLTSANVGYDFVRTVPCAVPDGDRRPPRTNAGAVNGAAVAALWSGSFNTWCDVVTFAAGAEAALLTLPALRVEVTGGAVPGHDDHTFEEFRRFVASSSAHERFLLHGWVSTDQLQAIYARADFGVSLGRWSYERALGSENRLAALLARSIPVIVSAGSELASEIGEAGAGLVVPPEDPRAFYDAMRALATDRDRRNAMSHAAHTYAGQHLTYSVTARPFLDWAEHPHIAPGRGTTDDHR